MTTTVAPAGTCPAVVTAPTPVSTAQPIVASGTQIAVPPAGRAHLHEHLAGPRRTDIDRLDREGTALFPQDGGVDAHQIGRRLYCGVIGLSTRWRPHSRC